MIIEKMSHSLVNIYGSASSQDVDLMEVVPESFKGRKPHESSNYCLQRIPELIQEFTSMGIDLQNRELNLNLCTLDNSNGKSIINWVYKGSIDECNNCLFLSYNNHKNIQIAPLFVTSLVSRRLDIKIIRSLRMILSWITRTNMRSSVKSALKTNTVSSRLKVLGSIQFENLIFTNNTNDDIKDIYKNIAFQLAQTITLLNNDEIFSKEEAYLRFPQLTVFLKRLPFTQSDLTNLTELKQNLVEMIETIITNDPKFGELQEMLNHELVST
jgi:hypothetical protein